MCASNGKKARDAPRPLLLEIPGRYIWIGFPFGVVALARGALLSATSRRMKFPNVLDRFASCRRAVCAPIFSSGFKFSARGAPRPALSLSHSLGIYFHLGLETLKRTIGHQRLVVPRRSSTNSFLAFGLPNGVARRSVSPRAACRLVCCISSRLFPCRLHRTACCYSKRVRALLMPRTRATT